MTTQTLPSCWTILKESCPHCGGAFGEPEGEQKFSDKIYLLATCEGCHSTQAIAEKDTPQREGHE